MPACEVIPLQDANQALKKLVVMEMGRMRCEDVEVLVVIAGRGLARLGAFGSFGALRIYLLFVLPSCSVIKHAC